MSQMLRTVLNSQLRDRQPEKYVTFQDSSTTSFDSPPLSRQTSTSSLPALAESSTSIPGRSLCSEKSLPDTLCFKDTIIGESKLLSSLLRKADGPFRALQASSVQYLFSADPSKWGTNISPDVAEDDDDLHDPDVPDKKNDDALFTVSRRGFQNIGGLVLLTTILVGLFAGLPIAIHYAKHPLSKLGGFGIGGINASGQVPFFGNYRLIDEDTPIEAYEKKSWNDGTDMELVFSDEFNTDGRTFYPGDDPYWEASDMHYWSTNDMEWYDPAAVTTANGYLQITMSRKDTHNLKYQSAQLSTWNKFCFTGGYIEVNVSLPGVTDVTGFWPSIWTMGNLGRAGYGATVDGTWPYSYDSCDVGTAPNQTINGQPHLATIHGDPYHHGALSYLVGQRLSRCTCPGESHPGPVHKDGTYVGRGAPEIDVFEALVDKRVGQVSQSSQWAPFGYSYEWYNTSENLSIPNKTLSYLNAYRGGIHQQATSVLTKTNQNCYTGEAGCFSVFGFEYKPGFDIDNSYITWIADNKASWALKGAGLAADPRVNISSRPVSQEPMYVIMQFGMSKNFQTVELDKLPFPSAMLVDYIRIYQKKGQENIGCDPRGFPTADYINTYIEAYTNPNLTTWVDDYKQRVPKNKLVTGCD
ncbi:beta-glucan synthesis-associated [Fomitiporia mediterranea MF3/22]|uniref:beta-glucan synthesis-associated n=1 Tax=Fomitiporia mediterranea (strain MF3/22) TaxID=694068 RepID=UPI0004407C1E|nr:beta-glucan synthesis-associated [Fomitiporia mediterranea MF3/22]EJD00930.1 beta-glucan synthesis-associated [Fomitiporia mediterranea MF3/22]